MLQKSILCAAVITVFFSQNIATAQESNGAKNSPDLDLRTGFAGSGFSINAGADSSSVSLLAGRSWEALSSEKFSTNEFSLKFTAPINKSTKSGSFLTNTVLADSLSAEISYARTIGKEPPLPTSRDERKEIVERARKRCVDAAATEDIKKRCAGMTAAELAKDYMTNAEKRKIRDNAFLDTSIWRYGLSASIGYEEFDYKDAATFEELDTTKTPYSAGIFAGVAPDDRAIYYGAGYQYKVTYQDADEQILCMPSMMGANIECFEDSFSEPERNVDSVLYALARLQSSFSLGKGEPIPVGVEFRVGYDIEDEVTGVSLPVYFYTDSESSLRGGIKTEWQEDEDEVELSLFIASSFDLFKVD
jgi:hypothetical protein